MRETIQRRLGLAGTALLLVVGCSSTPERPPATRLKPGLTLLDVRDPAWGANAAYVRDGRVVYLETRIGPLKPEVYRKAFPNDPVNEADLRVVDQHGDTFVIQRGGDRFVDATWYADIAAAGAVRQIVPAERALDFKLAQEAAKAFAIAAPPSFKDHVYHVSLFAAQPLPSQNAALQAKEQAIAKQLPTENSYASNGNWNYWVADQFSACVDWFCIGEHSSQNYWNCSWTGVSPCGGSGQPSCCNWTYMVTACDHGRCTWDDGMGYVCSSGAGWFWNNMVDILSLQSRNASNSGTGDDGGSCTTSYAWYTGDGTHNSNDDAAYNLWSLKNGGPMGGANGGFSVTDGAGNHFACSCSSWCNDFSVPACP